MLFPVAQIAYRAIEQIITDAPPGMSRIKDNDSPAVLAAYPNSMDKSIIFL